MVVLRGRLFPKVGAVVCRALEVAADRVRNEGSDDGVETTAGQRRADALGLVAESALAGHLDRGTAGDRYPVVVHVDEAVLPSDGADGQSVLEAGDALHVSAETSRRMACDASTVVMRHDVDGRVLDPFDRRRVDPERRRGVDVGRKTRVISPALRRALTARQRHCRFPGCSARHCDAHHVRHWADGGATKLDNLVLLCRHHHRAVHEGGFTVRLGTDGTVAFFQPDGQLLPAVPPTPQWHGPALAPKLAHLDPFGRLKVDPEQRRGVDAAGTPIGPHTATPYWQGEPLDEDWAISVLWRPRTERQPASDVSAQP